MAVEVDRKNEEIWEMQDWISPGISACVGCNVELTLRLCLKALGPRTVLAIPPGCMGGVGVVGWGATTGARVPVFFPLLDNTAAMLAGIKLQYERRGEHINAVAFAGDGATVDAGFQCLSGAAERGDDIIYICYDNEGYMNTGFQRSGSTTQGSWTSTTPVGDSSPGKSQKKKDFPMIMAMHDLPYVATASPAYPRDLVAKVQKAMQKDGGTKYIHVLNPCPNGWGFSADESIEIARLSVQTRVFPLFEMEDGQFSPTVAVKNPRPPREYLSRLKKFRHLDDEGIAGIEETVQHRWERLQKLMGEGRPCRD